MESNTMKQFKETVTKINDLREQEKAIRSQFEVSTGELAECFHYILTAQLDGRKHSCLTTETCPELYALELGRMGFDTEPINNVAGITKGYRISWD